MYRYLVLLVIAFAGVTSASRADDLRASLIAQIETGGQNEWHYERHAVKVDECHLTTYRWKQLQGDGWTLWTSFRIPMADVTLDEIGEDRIGYLHAPGEPDTALVFFVARPGRDFAMEKPFLRQPRNAYVASPRGDGQSYYVERIRKGFYTHRGHDVEAKAKMFTEAFNRYVQTFCSFYG